MSVRNPHEVFVMLLGNVRQGTERTGLTPLGIPFVT